VAVTPNILHVLQAANPDMDMSQILNMMQMAWEADPDPPIPHVHRGGPRPAGDPFAPGNLAAAAILAHGQILDSAPPTPPPHPADAPHAAAAPETWPHEGGDLAEGMQHAGNAASPAVAPAAAAPPSTASEDSTGERGWRALQGIQRAEFAVEPHALWRNGRGSRLMHAVRGRRCGGDWAGVHCRRTDRERF